MATLKMRKAGNLCSSTYQWTVNEKRWYWIGERDILTRGSNGLIQNFFNALLLKLVATVQGSYNRETHKLTVVL